MRDLRRLDKTCVQTGSGDNIEVDNGDGVRFEMCLGLVTAINVANLISDRNEIVFSLYLFFIIGLQFWIPKGLLSISWKMTINQWIRIYEFVSLLNNIKIGLYMACMKWHTYMKHYTGYELFMKYIYH